VTVVNNTRNFWVSGLYPSSGVPNTGRWIKSRNPEIPYIFWYCKRYEEQRVIMRDILSENSNKEYPVRYRALKARRKRFLQGVCDFINNIPIFI
jgi:hypothetical protein